MEGAAGDPGARCRAHCSKASRKISYRAVGVTDMRYFSDRNLGAWPRVLTEMDGALRQAVVGVIRNRANDGSIRHIRASLVGKNGIKANTWYELDKSGAFVAAENEAESKKATP